jgi:hypothetical protein
MGRFAQIREQFITAGCREATYDEFVGEQAWYALEYLIALTDVLLEEVPTGTRMAVEEHVERIILSNRDVMRLQRVRAVGA